MTKRLSDIATARKPAPMRIYGWREWVAFPELGAVHIKAKIDTGARTSALHATHISLREQDGETVVDFIIPALVGRGGQKCTAKHVDLRMIKNTSGIPEERLVIRTMLSIGGRRWPIDVSLTDRAAMRFDLILGRTAIRRHSILIDPGRSFLAGDPAGN
jgi:hypothetical protein